MFSYIIATNFVMIKFSLLIFNVEADRIYKESYSRGVGVPLSTCNDDQERNGALCYPKCQTGYTGVGPICWEDCQLGYDNHGATCCINLKYITFYAYFEEK